MNALQTLVTKFVSDMSAIVEEQERIRVRSVLAAFGGGKPYTIPESVVIRGIPDRPAKVAKKSRRKGPIQYCPSPGCKARSAPVFSMMCKAHKDAPKKLIAKWRADRRAKKANG